MCKLVNLKIGKREIKAADIKKNAMPRLKSYRDFVDAVVSFGKWQDYDNRELYVHNLTRLINYADQLDFGFSVPRLIRDNALTITDWGASGR